MRSRIDETGCEGLEEQLAVKKKRRRELLKPVEDHFQMGVEALREMRRRRRRLRRMCTKGSFPKETFEGRRWR